MTQFFRRYATPLTTGLFLVSLISGIAIFFHVGPIGFRPKHEWLSMVLILPFALHIWRNWRAFTVYFRHAPMAVALIVSVLAAGYYLLPSNAPQRGGPPQFAIAGQLLQAAPEVLAPALGTTPEALTERLAAQGVTVAPGQSLTEAATAAGKEPTALFAALLPPAIAGQ
ncbi:MAG TPA: DUF4405 domain-containing protein [Paracoccus sp. (in: a-proteobacteria)]|uniref:DUF4405 domain-containing protein n=1 Tax=uncultured Paracoccus sp. TaxID=189685 RepID=UPI00261E2EEE|nr:DUF4405 domain-containing protein [uncultured Paracoccus sp.]HMQ41021.1 DUF4405 domain-containing protein [Paracoccus sp. (in: a-proteobacteria)]HMR37031.1 DUF4405 domain-containing protein [Paracoccus sp. (in: a-proteobacteria)]